MPVLEIICYALMGIWAWFLARAIVAWLWRRNVTQRIIDSVGGDFHQRPKLRKVEDALLLCERFKVYLPPETENFYDVHRGQGCVVCGQPAQFTELMRAVHSPFLYRHMLNYSPYDGRRRPDGEDCKVVLAAWRGTEYADPFCSRECYASRLLWTLWLPRTRKERFWRPLMMSLWFVRDKLSRL